MIDYVLDRPHFLSERNFANSSHICTFRWQWVSIASRYCIDMNLHNIHKNAVRTGPNASYPANASDF